MKCRICGADGTAAHAFRFADYDVARCARCTGEFLEPQPSDQTLAAIYTADYFFKNTGAEEQERHRALKRATAQKSFDQLLSAGATRTGTLLEIGGGTGDFLVEAEQRGFEATGVEFSQSSASATEARIKGRVLIGNLEDLKLADASFDVIANSDVIEHVRDPLAFAREMRRVLRPGGTALIATPSLDSWSRKVMGLRWVEYKTEHLFYFNRLSIETLLREAGFTKISIRPNVKSLSFDYIAGHFEKFPIPMWTGLVSCVRRLVPSEIAHRPIDIVASGMTIIAS
jgi:SAM-dependent methyltransferase